MYSFRDITDHTDITNSLPSEAVSINGQYIENVLSGYRTLYTKGRESLGAELNTFSVGVSNGERFKSKRYPSRIITVGFQLICDDANDFREKFNNLNNLLSLEKADFVFHDEEDKFFTGYPIMDAEVEEGENSVKGEWHIRCLYPFKRSVEPIIVTSEDAQVSGNTATFNIDYKGVIPAYPVLCAEFSAPETGGNYSEDGDCGFVAFMDAYNHIIQLGNPDALDLDETAITSLINKAFTNISGWTSGGTAKSGSVTGTMTTGSINDTQWNRGKGQTQNYAKPNSYGSGTGMHGSGLYKTVTASPSWNLSIVHRICCNSLTETGCFECAVRDSSKILTGFVITKDSAGTTGTVSYIINDVVVGTDTIDLSYYNEHFGYCKKTPVYVTQTYEDPVTTEVKERVVTTENGEEVETWVTRSETNYVTKTREVFDGYTYTQSNLNSSIVKAYNQTIFRVGNLPARTFNSEAINDSSATRVAFYFGTKGTALHTNAVASCAFRKTSGYYETQPNVFTAGDVVEADCNDATIALFRAGSMGGYLTPNLGAFGNDWESFCLKAGSNLIRAVWSPWVNSNYVPTIKIMYNEVYI